MVLLHKPKHPTKVKLADDIEGVPTISTLVASGGIIEHWAYIHLKPFPQIHCLLRGSKGFQSAEENLGAEIDVLLGLQNIGKAVNMVYYSSPLPVPLVVHLSEDIAVLAEVLSVPRSVELRLVQGLLGAIDELDSFRRCAGNLIRAGSEDRTILFMKTSCGFLRCG